MRLPRVDEGTKEEVTALKKLLGSVNIKIPPEINPTTLCSNKKKRHGKRGRKKRRGVIKKPKSSYDILSVDDTLDTIEENNQIG